MCRCLSSLSACTEPIRALSRAVTAAPLRLLHRNLTQDPIALTESVAVLRGGAHALALDLHVAPAGAAVELVDAHLPPAELVRLRALLPHVLLKIRRRLILPLFSRKGKT